MSDGKQVTSIRVNDFGLVKQETLRDMIKTMSETGMMPIDTGDGTSASATNIYDYAEQYTQLEYAGDLLACEAISPKEWAKLKMLLKSVDEENRKLATKILNAKGGTF